MHKIIAVVLAMVAICSLAGGAKAWYWPSNDISVENEHTNVMTIAKADVDTGRVSQFSWGGVKVAKTGSVSVVGTEATSVVNYTDFSVAEPEDEHLVTEGGESWRELGSGATISKTLKLDTTGRAGHVVKLTAIASGSNSEESTTNSSSAFLLQTENNLVS